MVAGTARAPSHVEAMISTELPDGSMQHVDPRGVLRIHDLGRGVRLHVVNGLSLPEHAPFVIDDCDRALREHGRCIVLVDAFDSKMMTTEFREQMTGWFKVNGKSAFAHILIRSKLWEMAINVANLVLGTRVARVYSKVSEWEAIGRAEIAGFRRRPLEEGL
jgi:hypothetical protein